MSTSRQFALPALAAGTACAVLFTAALHSGAPHPAAPPAAVAVASAAHDGLPTVTIVGKRLSTAGKVASALREARDDTVAASGMPCTERNEAQHVDAQQRGQERTSHILGKTAPTFTRTIAAQ